MDLKNQVVAALGGSNDGIREGCSLNENQSNGLVERAVETVGGMIRTHNLAVVQ